MVAHEYAHAADRAPPGRRHGLHARTGHAQSAAAHRSLDESAPAGADLVRLGRQFTFGGAKPVPVNPRKFRNYRAGRHHRLRGRRHDQSGALAGLFALLFVLLGSGRSRLPPAMPALDTAQRMMVYGIWLNLVLCFFNLIPVPPLDGSHLLYHALPPRAGTLVPRAAAVRLSAALRAPVLFPAGGLVPPDAGVSPDETSCCGSSCHSGSVTDGTSSRHDGARGAHHRARRRARLRRRARRVLRPAGPAAASAAGGAARDRGHPHRADRRPVPSGHPRARPQPGRRLPRHGEPAGAPQGADAAAAPLGGGRLGGSARGAGAAAARVPADPRDRRVDGPSRRAAGGAVRPRLPAATARAPAAAAHARPARACCRRSSG